MPLRLSGRAATTGAVALAAVLAIAAGARTFLPLDAGFPLRAALYFVVMAAIAVIRIDRENHPFAEFGSANSVTMARAAFVALVAGVIGESDRPAVAAAAAGAAFAVTVVDGVDGWLARRTGMSSAFGARFD
ncbi:MAG TPA: CDP-alcohol phosphatidyltransferase family protein, partial [Vicinamibacterales bacterium]|nr:CDP-alcohol phosphatidyltransferase family protein [Vicinamibacterales bacterium]